MNEQDLKKRQEVCRTDNIITLKKRIIGLQVNESHFKKPEEKELYNKTLSELQTTLQNLIEKGVK